jgi:hypothetical protein
LKKQPLLGVESLASVHVKLLKLFLGDVVLSLPPRRKLRYKQAYEDFKLRFTFIFIGLSLIQLLLITTSPFFDALAFFFCLYYYSTVVLREHILVVNGSDIRAWWIVHHYVCVGVSGIMLIWPSGPSYHVLRPILLSFFIYIGTFPIYFM